MSAVKRSASNGPSAPYGQPAIDTSATGSNPPRPVTAAALRSSISQLQAMLLMLDSSVGPASSTSGWEDPFALDPADLSQPPFNSAKPAPPSSAAQGNASDSDESDDAPLMQQSYSRPPTNAAPTPVPADPTLASRAEFSSTGIDTSQPLPSTGLVQQIEDLLVPLQAPNGAVLSHLDQAFSEFGMPSIETRYTTAMQRTQHLLQLLHAGTSSLTVPLPAALGPSNITEASPSPLSLAARLLQEQPSLRVMRARNDHVRKRLRLGATAPYAVAPSTPFEPVVPSSTGETSTKSKSSQPKLPAAVLSGWDGQWSYSRASVGEYLSSLQTWLEGSVPSTTPPGKKERNIRFRMERTPSAYQMNWGTWIAHLTLPPAPEVYVSFMIPSTSTQAPELDPVNVTRITAHSTIEPQSNRPRPRPSGTPASPALNTVSNPAPKTPDPVTVDRAALLPGPTRALREYEERLFGAVLADSAESRTSSATWTSALGARHALSRQVHPPSQSTAAPSNTVPSQDPATVHVDEQVDLSPWNPLGQIVLELLTAGAA